jgi:hypothetical protein
MKYFIKRDLNEYGPYTLADLQRYVAQGNISVNDLTRGEGMTDWVPVSQILASAPAAPPPQPAAPAAAAAYPAAQQPAAMQPGPMQPVVAQPGYPVAAAQVVSGPIPPDFHWALVLVISMFCSIFQIVWLFIEAAFVKKIKPQSNYMVFLILGIAVQFVGIIIFYGALIATAMKGGANPEPPVGPFVLLLLVVIVAAVLYLVGIFKMRDAIQEYYNTVEPINLHLSGVMTFFFAVFYFQHHFTRIAQWKKTGILQPQG